jgi:hypothetical protein
VSSVPAKAPDFLAITEHSLATQTGSSTTGCGRAGHVMTEALDRVLSADRPVTRDYLRAELAELRAELRAEIRGLHAEMIKHQRELVWRTAGLLLIQTAAIIALLKLLP